MREALGAMVGFWVLCWPGGALGAVRAVLGYRPPEENNSPKKRKLITTKKPQILFIGIVICKSNHDNFFWSKY